MSGAWRDGNRVELLINGEQFYPRVLAAIADARHEVLLETFILFEDKVGCALQQALIDAARRIPRVEITVDGYGSADLSADFVAHMVDAGVQVHVFDPHPRVFGLRAHLFRRLHRKMLVIDGERAFIGGLNFSADHLRDFGPMAKQDYAVDVRGPVVADIRDAALGTLAQVTPVGPSSPATPPCGPSSIRLAIRDNQRHRDDIETQYLKAIRAARQRLVLANAYFFPGYRLIHELRNAARRGVEVSLILQGQPDLPWARGFSRLLYNYLMRDGVAIHEYVRRPMHGKVALADHNWATVGSSNLDPLSLSLNLEANLIIRDIDFNKRLHRHLERLMTHHCRQVTQQRLLRGHWWRGPVIFLYFNLLRYFPAIAGWLPAHRPELASIPGPPAGRRCKQPQ
ncbi:cardiolipin synthase ClsB [Pseudomonas protegens]|uniref:Cardiolipin synthase B n=3 Tax=Pseudomonas protegens TaxID=380021 RepID=Q4K7F6_PSEF5|nr:cardiolipin synthase ClsB [Pseudomonas protegens]AAY93976.1 putative cardiolipin synthetase YbhO [Pseudomonas protegens Pf-5]ASE21841.1 cardiolipin synthase ClsB [Pseudomonas protegens]QEZ54472.1 cardiolipin synthase ClsB [Pseudomonas protegens]QEZ59323.1 cardiolipin synthase ClsB [Pseudomonas protegens]QEZ65762.1 cardiolipin synthase ClsB [Pseudomonas protegens]